MTTPGHVIVGASLAGASAAAALRKQGFDGSLTLFGDEPERPYERPELSKKYLRGEQGRTQLSVHDEQFYEKNQIELRLGTPVRAIDVGARQVVTDGGRVGFDQLLLATGVAPRRLSLPGSALAGICYLRTADDADAIRQRAERATRVVVVGGGWIGSEVAASLRQLGSEVTLIVPTSAPLENVLGAEVGAVYREIHGENGVAFVPRTRVVAYTGAADVEAVLTEDGQTIPAELVVVGVGADPRTELAEAAGLDVDRGVLVDERLQTSAPGIFAAGDVANAWHPWYGRFVRVEHWDSAKRQGRAAAENMLGLGKPYERIPYFYSDQYDVGMEYTGHSSPADRVVFRGDPAKREFIAFWLRDDKVVAGMNVNVWDVAPAIERLIRSRAVIDPERLADPDIALDQLVADEVAA